MERKGKLVYVFFLISHIPAALLGIINYSLSFSFCCFLDSNWMSTRASELHIWPSRIHVHWVA